MKGTLLITFDERFKGRDGSYFTVQVNGVERQNFYFNSNNLYSTYLNVGDVVTITFTGTSAPEVINVSRRDFTTDDEGGDLGIKLTNIASTNTGVITFTATTVSCAYSFYYIIESEYCFNVGTGFNNEVTDIDILSDGNLLMSGEFTTYNGTPASRIIKLNTDGSIDTTFVYGSGFTPDTSNSVVERSDGKLVVVGQFLNYNGTAANGIIGLNADGSINTSFVYGSGFTSASGIPQDAGPSIVQSDDKVIIGGIFSKYNGTLSPKIARINTNGSYDSTFVVGSGFTSGGTSTDLASYVTSLGLQSSGKVIVVGRFDAYNGNAAPRIARLNTDGSFDSSFNGVTSGFNDNILSIAIQPDNKILCAGAFTSYNGVSKNRLVRLNADGSIDASFSGFTTGFNNYTTTVDLQSDGKILVGGAFTNCNGTTYISLIRLNSDGSNDTSFGTIGGGVNDEVLDIVPNNDGLIYVGGKFTSYNGVTVYKIMALDTNGDLISCQSLAPTPTPTPTQTITPTITPTQTITPTIQEPTPTPTLTPTITPPTPTPTMTPTITLTPTITPTCFVCERYANNTFSTLEIDYQSCEGTWYYNQLINPTDTVCIVPGSGGGTDWASMSYQSTCSDPCPTPTPTPTPASEANLDLTNFSLDIQITGVYVNGVDTTVAGGSMPNTSGNGTTLATTQVGTYDVLVYYSCSVAGQHITFTDSDLNVTCIPALTGSNSYNFTSAVVATYHNPSIEAADGTC